MTFASIEVLKLGDSKAEGYARNGDVVTEISGDTCEAVFEACADHLREAGVVVPRITELKHTDFYCYWKNQSGTSPLIMKDIERRAINLDRLMKFLKAIELSG